MLIKYKVKGYKVFNETVEFSFEANKKSKLNELNAGIKSNSKKATSLIGVERPLVELLKFCKKVSVSKFKGELRLLPE